MGISKNRGTPKWMVYNGKPNKIDDLGIPLFLETPICFVVFCPAFKTPRLKPEIFSAPEQKGPKWQLEKKCPLKRDTVFSSLEEETPERSLKLVSLSRGRKKLTCLYFGQLLCSNAMGFHLRKVRHWSRPFPPRSSRELRELHQRSNVPVVPLNHLIGTQICPKNAWTC